MLQGEHSAILSTYIKLPFVMKVYVLSIFEWPFYTRLILIFSIWFDTLSLLWFIIHIKETQVKITKVLPSRFSGFRTQDQKKITISYSKSASGNSRDCSKEHKHIKKVDVSVFL